MRKRLPLKQRQLGQEAWGALPPAAILRPLLLVGFRSGASLSPFNPHLHNGLRAGHCTQGLADWGGVRSARTQHAPLSIGHWLGAGHPLLAASSEAWARRWRSGWSRRPGASSSKAGHCHSRVGRQVDPAIAAKVPRVGRGVGAWGPHLSAPPQLSTGLARASRTTPAAIDPGWGGRCQWPLSHCRPRVTGSGLGVAGDLSRY